MAKVVAESGKGPSPTSRRVAQLLDQSIETSRSLAMEISPPFRFGSGLVAAFTVFVAAQFAMGALVDHFGWMGSAVRPLTLSKVTGMAVVLGGIWLILRD